MDIAILLTGNELMSGDTVDSNSASVAKQLSASGFSIAQKVTVGDDLQLIADQLERLASQYPVLIINGGLGPTDDDLTAEVLARATGLPLELHAGAKAHVELWCSQRKSQLNAANLKQAMLPRGCDILANTTGSAVGIYLQYRGCHIFCTPGVPSEMRPMIADVVLPHLLRHFPTAKNRYTRRLKLFGLGESRVQQIFYDGFPDWPEDVAIGFRAGAPLLELKLEVENEALLSLRDRCEQQLRERIGDFIVGENDQTLADVVVDLLVSRGQKLALAESCTGGMIASSITSVDGASRVFEAGVVSYSNAIKHSMLEVDTAVLARHGAVSEAVVRAMAMGALRLSQADYAIAVSGIAGPSGGSDDKPVGTVWIAWGDSDNMAAECFFYPAARQHFQLMISALALDLMRRRLLGIEQVPRYFKRAPA